ANAKRRKEVVGVVLFDLDRFKEVNDTLGHAAGDRLLIAVAERMKSAGSMFSDKNGLWSAHKLRNRIAHESDIVVNFNDARYALSSFKKALKDLGAI
ncbi:diguanylate cyclase, partial [Candidatus Saccharibacteria bacterium]|nr:diguanylate cyclase [Candidatus Saccharibacteria bacterium]